MGEWVRKVKRVKLRKETSVLGNTSFIFFRYKRLSFGVMYQAVFFVFFFENNIFTVLSYFSFAA